MSTINWLSYYQLARLHKPVGIYLFYWPFVFALLISARERTTPLPPLLQRLALYALGSVLLRSAACVLNDIFDIEIDRKVERTKNRPLPRGDVSVLGSILFLLGLTAGCLGLLFFVNPLAWRLGNFGLFALNLAYPLTKRVTNWPQAWLGITINWGYVVACADVNTHEGNELVIFAMMLGLFCWTMVYDTVYACQDMQYDAKLSVGSTALLFGSYIRPVLYMFSVAFIASLAFVGYQLSYSLIFWVISVGGATTHILWQVYTFDPSDNKNCQDRFLSNIHLGFIVSSGMALDYCRSLYSR